MHFARRRLRWLIGAWLLCQAATVASAPLALWRSSKQAASDAAPSSDDTCCPGVAPGQVCPMHHTKEGGRKCAMRNACPSAADALVALSGVVGLERRASRSFDDRSAGAPVRHLQSNTIARASRPESPPPRA